MRLVVQDGRLLNRQSVVILFLCRHVLYCAVKGQLTYLQWDDVTCNPCGGLASQQCIITKTAQPQHSCAGLSPPLSANILSQKEPLSHLFAATRLHQAIQTSVETFPIGKYWMQSVSSQ